MGLIPFLSPISIVLQTEMGISRDSLHKRRATGGKRPQTRKKRAYDAGRPAAMTKLMPQRVHMVRTRGGNKKYRALRLDQGVFSWATEAISRKVRIIDVVYNASNNELVRTKTLVKGAIVTIDSTPFRQWYESHYATALGRKKNAKLTKEEDEAINGKKIRLSRKKIRREKEKRRSRLLPCRTVPTRSFDRAYLCSPWTVWPRRRLHP